MKELREGVGGVGFDEIVKRQVGGVQDSKRKPIIPMEKRVGEWVE